MAYTDDPVEPGKSIEMPNWVIGLFLIGVITEIVVLQTFLLPDGSWNIATPSFFIGSNHSTSEKRHRIQGYLLDSVWDFAFLHPRALALDRENAIYVGESYQGSGSHARILKFNHEGILLGWWGKGNRTS